MVRKARKIKAKVIEYEPYCPECQTWRVGDGSGKFSRINFCPDCGSKLSKQHRCEVCRAPVAGNWKYCANCGVDVNKIQEVKDAAGK